MSKVTQSGKSLNSFCVTLITELCSATKYDEVRFTCEQLQNRDSKRHMLKNTLLISSLVVTSIAFPQLGGPGGAKSQEKGTLGAAVKQGAKDPEQIVPIELDEDDYHIKAMAKMGGANYAPIVFFASYGDNNQSFDNSAGSIDKRTSYAWPALPFNTQNHGAAVDMDQITHDHVYPYAISGYPRFNPKRVLEAKLRFDVYIQPNVSLWDNDSIGGWDDNLNKSFALIKGAPTGSKGDFGNFLEPFLKARKANYAHWVSIVFDLTPNAAGGGVYVYDINPFGNPITGRYWGMFKTISPLQQMQVLKAASDGDLQGWLQDDTPLSYAELMIKAY